MADKILITSALPYVNNVPHLGNIIGCVLSADVFARFSRARGNETLFICGTDEHGTATETKALEEGLTPKQICDKYYKIHREIYEWFGCSFDAFGRTSTDTHTEVTQSIFRRIHENGFITKGELEQTYCPKCDKFLADRFVEGTCPHCGYENARGDQCESCGRLLNPVELLNSRCKVCGSKPVVRKSDHLFLDLPKIGPELEKWSVQQSGSGFWTQNAVTVTNAWFREGLKERCISRDLKWGVPIPLEGYTGKVFYVWFDAPIGYISITKHAFPDAWESWWHGGGVKLYQFMAKDNIPFHTIIFPASLIATRDAWTMLHHIDSTEYLNYEGGKFSKSAGTGVFGDDAKGTGIPADVWRYYLLSSRPEGADSFFSWKEFQDKNNNELLANLGNFVNRTLTFTQKYFGGRVPEKELEGKDDRLIQDVSSQIAKVIELLENVRERDALKEVMQISRLGNQYFQENAPWNLVRPAASKSAVPPSGVAQSGKVCGPDRGKSLTGMSGLGDSGQGAELGGTRQDAELFDDANMKRCATVLNVCCNLVRTLAVMIEPFLPHTSGDIFAQLALDGKGPRLEYKMHLDLEPGHAIAEPKVLFRKLEDREIDDFRRRFGGRKKEAKKEAPVEKLEEFPADLRVAKVLSVDDHPDAGKLYVLKIDLGTEQRQLVAGLKAYIPRENLLGKHIIVVCNLRPAKLRGIESRGMLLAADDGKKVVLLEAPDSDPGDEVTLKGVPNTEPFRELSVDEFFRLGLVVDDAGHVVCENFRKELKTPVEFVVAKGIGAGAKVR
ncbi:methionine--tRNA ligase [Candidatus Woesearchaeota archaeon]|nr:methionine--tRNA ligase [Candidatus Woesearchaeota archaeon]